MTNPQRQSVDVGDLRLPSKGSRGKKRTKEEKNPTKLVFGEEPTSTMSVEIRVPVLTIFQP